ncbi:hypothetical protein NEI07_15365 [Methylocystis sp. NLS-7]|nr:hypothetical protein [Methylocystis suflitae]MCQ4190964.1 hypothetical protein [Methylocystis suflitae]
MEVRYPWHPYFRCEGVMRRIEQRATGQFLMVQAPSGALISIAGWMFDPMVCMGMTFGVRRHRYVFCDRHMREEADALKHIAYSSSQLMAGYGVGALTEDADRAAILRHKAVDHFKRRRFARARASNKRDEFVRFDAKGQIPYSLRQSIVV